MMRLNRTRSLALGCVAAFAVSAAPQMANAADNPPAVTETTTTTTTEVSVKEERHESRGDSWSTKGGATLGSGVALRAQFSAGTSQNINNGYLNFEAGLLFALGENFDLGVNLRVPLFNLGLSPGIGARWQFINDKQFHMSLVGNLQVPMLYVPGFWLGLSIEPGLMMSYFINDRVEFFSGLLFQISPLFINPWVPGSGHVGFMGTFRAGLAYTLSTSNVGFYLNLDIGAGYEPVRRFILVGSQATGIALNASLTAGSQFKF